MEGFNWSILGWIAVVIFVYFFGIFEGRSQGRKRRIAEEEQEKREQPAPPVITKVDDPGLLRLKNKDGVTTLDLDGKRVDTLSLNNEQRKRLIELLNAIRPWLDGKPASAPLPASPPPTSPSITPTKEATASVSPAVSAKQPTSSTKKKEDEPEVAPTSIVGQINAILQKRIFNTPLVSKGVSLMESVTGGVNVYVGVQRYETIDDVPDEEIKSAIRAAITEWENTYTPGL